MVGIAWFSEKLKLNVKFIYLSNDSPSSSYFFENSILSYSKTCQGYKFAQLKKPSVVMKIPEDGYEAKTLKEVVWEEFGHQLSSEYAYEVISELGIKQDVQQQADQWVSANIKKRCITVHYRGTDLINSWHIIKIESYIAYLKKVLDPHCDIFACSDMAQFIVKIRRAFPSRVFARDIKRSYDNQPLHLARSYRSDLQRREAFIDVLIAAKTEMIYTPGSTMIDVARYFNPSIKIITLDGKRRVDSNFLPVPYPDLVDKMQRDTAWKTKGYS